MRPRPCNRRGIGLAIALVAMVIFTMVAASLLRRVAAGRAAIRAEERTLQADWLAASGLERAAARLGADPSYGGETWELPADRLDGRHAASVRIEVGPVLGEPGLRLVTATADWPADAGPDRRARRTRTTTVAIPQTSSDNTGPDGGP